MNISLKTVPLLLFIFLAQINSYAQGKKGCSLEKISQTRFSADSMLRFNSYNTFRHGIIENIKDSKYQVELRYYFPKGNYSKTTNAYIIKGTTDSLILTKLETYALMGSLPGYRVASKYQKESINLKQTQTSLKGSYCELYHLLSTEDFFTIKGITKLSGFKKKDNTLTYTDSGSQAYFEVKLGDKVRNFIYDYNPEWIDSDIQREKHIHNIINYLINTFKENEK